MSDYRLHTPDGEVSLRWVPREGGRGDLVWSGPDGGVRAAQLALSRTYGPTGSAALDGIPEAELAFRMQAAEMMRFRPKRAQS